MRWCGASLKRICSALSLALPMIASVPAAAVAANTNGTSDPADRSVVQERPSGLPSYYAEAFSVGPETLRLQEHATKGRLRHYAYATEDGAASLVLELFRCDGARCDAVFQNAVKYYNGQASAHSGQFRAASPSELHVEWRDRHIEVAAFAFVLPHSLTFWNYSMREGTRFDRDARFARLRLLADRERYEEALAEGNVEMGRWGPQIHDYARSLLKKGKKTQALAVYRDLLATSAFDYEGHIEFAENTNDKAAARESAEVVLDNAEDPKLIAEAERLLGKAEPAPPPPQILPRGEQGLQLILVPLPPANIKIIGDAAKIYEKITGVPTRIMRLPQSWSFGPPDRLLGEKAIRQAIIDQRGPNIDFSGWSVERYQQALMRTVAAKDALAKFSMRRYVERMDRNPGQYDVDPLLNRFTAILDKYRSTDRRTMYVGITEKNIYAVNTNFLFSAMSGGSRGAASILSYAMMLAKTLGEPYQSRKRLAERIAKELVPASLKALGIPRATDPTDPYSYSSGIDRLDQKSLTLSAPVKEALEKFRWSDGR